MARLPSAMTDDSPPFVPRGASLDSRTGSPRVSDSFTTRSPSTAGSLTAPAGRLPAGQATVFSMSGVKGLPSWMSRAATTTLLVAISLWRPSHCAARTTAMTPSSNAMTSMTIARVFFMIPPASVQYEIVVPRPVQQRLAHLGVLTAEARLVTQLPEEIARRTRQQHPLLLLVPPQDVRQALRRERDAETVAFLPEDALVIGG